MIINLLVYLVLVLVCFGEEMNSESSYFDILTLYLLDDIFNSNHSKGYEPYLIVHLTEISLKTNDVEHLSMHLLVFMKYMFLPYFLLSCLSYY